ncbi:MAG: hypothetical protein PUF55_02610 [Bacteroidales bacterium]|nr:hypothetical protein [Bacteroidales bacterium]
MKKKYIKPTIIIIETCNDDCNMVGASLYDINKVNSIETIADEDDQPNKDDWGTIWND